MKILGVLKVFCKEVEKDNPFNLVLKGGTALALYYFNHRESKDLDLRFKNLKESQLSKFLKTTMRKLRIVANLISLKVSQQIYCVCL